MDDENKKAILHDLEEILGSREELRRRKSHASESESKSENPNKKQLPSRHFSTLSYVSFRIVILSLHIVSVDCFRS